MHCTACKGVWVQLQCSVWFQGSAAGAGEFSVLFLRSCSLCSSKRSQSGKLRHEAGLDTGCVKDRGERGLRVPCRPVRSHANTHENQLSIQNSEPPATACPLHHRLLRDPLVPVPQPQPVSLAPTYSLSYGELGADGASMSLWKLHRAIQFFSWNTEDKEDLERCL